MIASMVAAEHPRPDPDALLVTAAREGKGRLKLFLGAAPGVGKTWDMLNAARRRRAEGVDVLVGVVEAHGRKETEAQIGDLPLLPRQKVRYRGHALDEFDLDAALARRPGLLLVDELAHTNAPGGRHHKRWEDVAELLEAGIDVWATVNIQHLESLNDAIARITGVRVTETMPDRVLEMADEIEFVDIPPAELRARLRSGRIYRPDLARRALEGFFREGNLAALREIALREVAQKVDHDVRDYMRRKAIVGPWPAGDRVLAVIGGDASADSIVRAARRLAEALRAPWIVLHVERPGGVEDTRHALEMAAQLGATVEIRAGTDLVRATRELAAARNVTHLVIGRETPRLWRRLLGLTLTRRLLRQDGGLAIHIVPAAGARTRRAPTPRAPNGWLPWVAATLLVGLIVLAGEVLAGTLEHEALGMLFLAVVVAAATLWGLAIALYAAALGFLSWNILFIPPLYSLTIEEPRDVIALFVFAGIAVTSGWLASRVRLEARVAQGRIENLRRITGFGRRLGEPTTETELLLAVVRLAADIGGRAVVLLMLGEDLSVAADSGGAAMGGDDAAAASGGGTLRGDGAAAGGGTLGDGVAARRASLAADNRHDGLDEGAWAAALWAWTHREQTGHGTGTLPSSAWRFIPMATARGLVALLGLRPDPDAPLDLPRTQALSALADQSAMALDRMRLAAAAARGEAQAETQKLRAALLSSLSHDLRTPLTGIRGAAGSLRMSWNDLSPAARDDLLASIEHDTVRMTGFIANITDMIRLESGEIEPRRRRLPVAGVVESAIARLPDIGLVTTTSVPEDLPDVLADPDLFEQVLVNVLENAVKYSPENAFIRVSAEALAGFVRISIADEGVGILPADLPHVFDSFYRAQRGDRTIPGTGLGLAIARGLVEAMGGRIAAESPRPDAPRDGAPGTVMHIDVPVAS
jgi:two-component system, OmpR family, sensor histidine kinase KdpD